MEPNKIEPAILEPAEKAPQAPVRNPETERPVRRVGSLTLGVCLIAAGVFFLCFYFVPNFNSELVLRIAPAAGLCLLGGEVLFFAARPKRWKYDFLSVFICLVLMVCCFCMSFLPVLVERFGPDGGARETKISTEYEKTLYAAIQKDAPEIAMKDIVVWLRDYYGKAETVSTAAKDINSGLGVLHLNIELFGPYEQKAAFAMDCRKLTDIIQKQVLQPAVVTFYYDGVGLIDEADDLHSGSMKQECSYTLTLNDRVQLDWTADQMTKQTEEANLMDEENALSAEN